jgi:two-component system sensor histidine kinase KdpD
MIHEPATSVAPRPSSVFFQTVVRFLVVIAAVGFVTLVDFRVARVNSATAAFTFLLLVLLLAARVGLRESITASVASMLAYNFFFLPPVGTLTIVDPQNWVALFVFLATAFIASHLSSTARRQAQEAKLRQQELQQMYDFSRALMLGDDEHSLPQQTTRKLFDVFAVDEAWFYDAATDSFSKISSGSAVLAEGAMRQVTRTGKTWRDAGNSVLIVPIRLGGRAFGSLGVRSAKLSEMALEALAQLIAIASERARVQQAATRIEAARQNEQLKSTLLDALAHEFKTPLTAVKAAASTLLAQGRLQETEREMATVIDEESDRMTQLVSDSIELARIGTSTLKLHRQPLSARELITNVLREMQRLCEGREMQLDMEDDLPLVAVDRKLIELALRQLLSNALKYSPAGSPIGISTRAEGKFVVLRFANEGPEIAKVEQELVFEKFYRGRDVRNRVAGTGMGLSISREIVQAHGGRIWVESEPGSPTQFSIALPALAARGVETVRTVA